MHDCIVVGGSVAGAATAVHLARAGARVLVLERESFPRRKVCGEGLFPMGVTELDRLGVLERVAASAAPLSLLSFEVDGQDCTGALSASGRTGLGVKRALLDSELLEAASRAGAGVVSGCRVTGLAGEGDRYDGVLAEALIFPARTVVAADGLGSALRTKAGLGVEYGRRRYGVSGHFELTRDAGEAIRVHFRRGYEMYVTPVGNREANVAVLMDSSEAGKLRGDLNARFLEYAAGLPALEGASPVERPAAAGPFPASARRLWARNLLLVGDAGGFHDAISGEGMSIALRSARLAAQAVLSYLETGETGPFVRYEASARQMRRPSTLFASLILALRDRPVLARRAVRNLARRPETFARLVALNGGELGLRDLRPRDLAGLLLGM